MADPKSAVIRYDDFRGGDFGTIDARRAPGNSFKGSNVMVYTDGKLGPRPGLKKITPTGLANGVIGSYWVAPRFYNYTRDVVYSQGTAVRGFKHDSAPAITTFAGALATTPVRSAMEDHGPTVLLSIRGDKMYGINPTAATVTAIAGTPAGEHLAIYGLRVISVCTANANRVNYSDANNPLSWPALNFFDVGYAPELTFIHFGAEIRNRFVMATEINGEWWHLTGVPGVNDVLRRPNRTRTGPARRWHASRMADAIWHTPRFRSWPVEYVGNVSDRIRYRHLAFGVGSTEFAMATVQEGPNAVVLLDNAQQMLLRHNEIWTRHSFQSAFPIPSGSAGPFVENVWTSSPSVATVPDKARFILCDGGAAAAPPNFFAFEPTLDRPGKASDSFAQPGDNSTTPLSAIVLFPEWWSDPNEHVRVRRIIVDFDKFDTGSASTNHFDFYVFALGCDDGTFARQAAIQSFDEATAGTIDGADDQMTIRVGDQGWGRGFQFGLANMRGVAIDAITVEIETQGRRA